jgi:hypothetical protein
MEERVRIARCKAQRLQVPTPLLGHEAYVRSLESIIGCLVVFAPTKDRPGGSPGTQIGISPQRIKNMLIAMAHHAAGDCRVCEVERRFHTMFNEQRLIDALAIYERSDHAKSPSGLAKISAFLKVADASSGEEGGEFALLPAFLLIFNDRDTPALTV